MLSMDAIYVSKTKGLKKPQRERVRAMLVNI